MHLNGNKTLFSKCKILYISYDGILEPLGQSQVLAYLINLAPNHYFHLISFEKYGHKNDIDREEFKRISEDLTKHGIIWHPLRYHKNPTVLATLWDIICGILLGIWFVLRYRLTIVHARSYVPSVMAVVIKKLTGAKYIFDMRGFWADERVDGEMWPLGGRLYLIAKWFEKIFLLSADYVISLTHAAVNEMITFSYLHNRMPPFQVITTCADLELFRPDMPDLLLYNKDSPFILGYVGNVRGWYLFDESLRCFKLLYESNNNVRMLIINQGEHKYIVDRLIALNINIDRVDIKKASRNGVAKAMQKMDAGIFFIKPVYSKIASAPTKLGEFLGCGVPCITNTGVGDMAQILEKENVGVTITNFDDLSLQIGINRLLQLINSDNINNRCRNTALRYFSLEDGVKAYSQVYKKLDKLDN